MRALLDNRPLTLEEQSVRCALQTARQEAEREHRIVIEAVGDGEPLSNDTLDAPPADAGGFEEIRFVSTDKVALIEVTLRDAADALDEAAARQREAAAALDRGDQDTARQLLHGALSTWQVVGDVVSKSGMLLGLDPASVAFDVDGKGRDGGSCIVSLQKRLVEAATAIQSNDWAAVSDLFGFDMDDEVEAWKALLNAMADRARTGQTGSGGAGS